MASRKQNPHIPHPNPTHNHNTYTLTFTRTTQTTTMKSTTLPSSILAILLPLLSIPIYSQSTETIPICTSNESLWTYTLTTDSYPWETSWELVRTNNNGAETLIASGPDGAVYDRRSTYTDSYCLTSGEYSLVLQDRMGDGFCCKFGNGAFEMKLNDEVVGEQYGGGFKVKQMDFVVEDSSGGFVWVEAVEETTEEATTTVVPTTTEETTTTTTTTDEPITTAAGPTTSEETTTTTTIEETTSSSTATTTTEISATEMVSFTILTEAKEEESDILDTISTDILDEITETTSTVDPWENYNPKWSKCKFYVVLVGQCIYLFVGLCIY